MRFQQVVISLIEGGKNKRQLLEEVIENDNEVSGSGFKESESVGA